MKKNKKQRRSRKQRPAPIDVGAIKAEAANMALAISFHQIVSNNRELKGHLKRILTEIMDRPEMAQTTNLLVWVVRKMTENEHPPTVGVVFGLQEPPSPAYPLE